MPTGTRPGLGNELFSQAIYVPSVTYPTLGANASGSNTLTVPGVLAGDIVGWNMQAPPAHLVMDNVYISAPNVMTILWSTDATGISTGTVAVAFTVERPENASLGLSALPANVL